MKKNIWLVLLVWFLLSASSVVWAESSVWIVSSPTANVYLAGSFHMLRASDYPLPSEFYTAYKNSRKVILEVAPDEEPSRELLAAAIYSDGTTLKDHITRTSYAKAENFCRERNYPIEQFQFMKPTMFVMTLTVLEMTRIGADPQKGIDYFFRDKAVQDGKAVGSLETMDEQINLLSSIDASFGSEQILESISEFKQMETVLDESLAVWRKGDERGMEELFIKELKGYPKLYQSVLADRNNKWLAKIITYLNGSGNTMVIVGAAHLVGPDGLVNLLGKRGYKVVKLRK